MDGRIVIADIVKHLLLLIYHLLLLFLHLSCGIRLPKLRLAQYRLLLRTIVAVSVQVVCVLFIEYIVIV
jgi:hypothetical protein